MKSLMPYILTFAALIIVAVMLGNQDPITSAIVEARAETSIGVVTMDVANQGLAFLAKLLAGATIAGVLSFAWMEGGKWYRKHWREELTRRWTSRWKPGPNANFQQQGTRIPKLTREDVLLMALAGRDGRVPNMRSMRVPRIADQKTDDEIELEL